MPRLIATLVTGPAFVPLLRKVWDSGDTLLPLDIRLPKSALDDLLEILRPSVLVDQSGAETKLARGVATEPGDALVVATSGTTGAPKGVVLTHNSIKASAIATSSRLRVDPGSDHWLACLPLAHIGGLSVITRAVITDTPLTVQNGFDPDEVEGAARNGATLVSLVATALARVNTDRFRTVLLGGSSMPEDLPSNVVTTYGMTETGSGVVYNGTPLDDVEVRSTDGELFIRSPMVGRCYRVGAKEASLVDETGWLHTGDAGSVDPSTGAVSVTGRIGDVVVSGGEKIWPEPVEAILRNHPKVKDVGISGRPDPDWGSRVVAFVVALDTGDPPALEELRDWIKTELPAYCAPRELVLRKELPRTPLGKLQRSLLDLNTD